MDNKKDGIRGYKVFSSNWKCRDYTYTMGEKHILEGELILKENGFHFCGDLANCFDYYNFEPTKRVAEVLATGRVINDGEVLVTDELVLVRELEWFEVLKLANKEKEDDYPYNIPRNLRRGNRGIDNIGSENKGNENVGDCNVGNRNVGMCNIGYRNLGNNNRGDSNVGYGNRGDNNVGDINAGSHNTGGMNRGYFNSGHCNIGNYNTGDFNKTNRSSGFFNTEEQKLTFFDEPSNWTLKDWNNSKTKRILSCVFNGIELTTNYLYNSEALHSLKKRTESKYSRHFSMEEMWVTVWSKLSDEDKQTIQEELPNFNKEKFEYITGLRL